MVGLVLPVLLLSVASDSEGSNEEAWTERFRKADEARKSLDIPPLTARERMAILLGQPLSLQEGSLILGYEEDEIVLEGKRYSVMYVRAFRCSKPVRGFFDTLESIGKAKIWKFSGGWARRNRLAAVDEVLSLAIVLLLPYDVSINTPGFKGDVQDVEYPW
jgi:hypothetical protein